MSAIVARFWQASLMASGGRLWLALSAYVVLAVMAAATLDGPMRLAVWVFLGGLAVKTYIASLQKP